MYFYIYFYMILSFYFIWFYYHILFAIYLISCYIYIFLFFYLFSHLAGAFVQNDLQMRTIEAIKNQQKSNNMQVLWQVLVSLTQ